MDRQVSVVIPAFNEEAAIGEVIDEIRDACGSHGFHVEVVVVDDGSADRTAEFALEAGARVARHRSNRGYGAALKTGILVARHDVIAITDADGTYPSHYLPQLLEALERADMVVGSRTGANVHIPILRRPAKWLLNLMANYVSGARIPDLNSGLRVFRREVVTQYFAILPDAFSWTSTITIAMHCDKYAVTYVPIDYRQRTGKSKIVPWDASAFAALILRTAMLFRPLRIFLPATVVFFGYGLVKMLIDLLITGDPNISASALLGFMSALIVLLIGMLGDALATRLGRLSPNAVAGVQPVDLHDVLVPTDQFSDSVKELKG